MSAPGGETLAARWQALTDAVYTETGHAHFPTSAAFHAELTTHRLDPDTVVRRLAEALRHALVAKHPEPSASSSRLGGYGWTEQRVAFHLQSELRKLAADVERVAAQRVRRVATE
jgi:hypothetical protein